jgi:hypothetical protein
MQIVFASLQGDASTCVKGQPSVQSDFDTMSAVEIRAMFGGDADLMHAVFSAQVVIYRDQWDNQRRTLEARALGIAHGQGPVLIGLQIDATEGCRPSHLRLFTGQGQCFCP